jgi:cytochrome c biogenesis protein
LAYIIRFFSSVRLALWVILLLAIFSLAGTLLRQMPTAIAGDPALREAWLEQVAQPNYHGMTDIYNFLGFFDFFHSPIFIFLGGLLIINIAVCSLKRWSSLVKTSKGVDVESAARLLEKGAATRATSKLSAADNTAAVNAFLSKRGYRIRQQEISGAAVFVADKNRFAPWGTYAIHLSLILLIAGYLLGSSQGFSNETFIVVENETRAVGAPYDFSVRLKSFTDEYYDSGQPKDYRSDVEILVNGQVVQQGLIRVNYPMSQGQLKIFQSFFGPAVTLHVADAGGAEIFNGSVALTEPFNAEGIVRNSGTLDLAAQNLFVFIINSAGPGDPVVPGGQVRLEFYDASPETGGQFLDSLDVPLESAGEFEGLKFTPGAMIQFSGFQLREDPGLGMIWAAFTLFMLGLGLVFYFPYRQMVVAVNPDAKGSRCSYSVLGKKNQAAVDEMEAFAQAIGATGQIQPKQPERNSKR